MNKSLDNEKWRGYIIIKKSRKLDCKLERMVQMSYSKLRGKIKEVFGTQDAFAEAMGMSTVSISHRLNGKLEWKTSEIFKACEVLGIPLEENATYFFMRKVKIS